MAGSTAGPHGLLLAAGAGRRAGGPKALRVGADGTPWLAVAVEGLLTGGCPAVTVVLGAEADRAARLLPMSNAVRWVLAEDWAEGMGASLRVGLAAVAETSGADAALVTLVDLPDVGAAVVARVLAAATGRESLVRAVYDGRPGHPVLLGRSHWQAVAAAAQGDRGARDYFMTHHPALVECGDLATGRDRDGPGD